MSRRHRTILLGFVLAGLLGLSVHVTLTEKARVESLVLPPYLESAVFDLFGEGREKAMEVFAPDAPDRPLMAGVDGVEEVRVGDILRTLIVRRPAAGCWIFRKSRPQIHLKTRSLQFYLRGALIEPVDSRPPSQYDEIFVTYRVTDRNGASLEELPGYPLAAEATLVQPGGLRLPLAMERQPQRGPGIFRARQKAACNLPGRYWVEVVVTTRNLDGRRVRVLQDLWSGFTVHAPAVLQKTRGHFRCATVSLLVSRTHQRHFGRWQWNVCFYRPWSSRSLPVGCSGD